MKINIMSLHVDDQEKALRFYTDDVKADYERIQTRGAAFTMPPTQVLDHRHAGRTPAGT